MKRPTLALASALAALPLVAAAAPDPWAAPFSIQIGAFDAQADTSIRLDSTSGNHGTSVSFEGDLGGEDRKTTPSFDMLWRFSPRHAMEISVISLRRDGDTILRGTLNFGDHTFPVNTAIHSTFDSDIARIAYRWSFVHDDRAEMSVLLGAHWTRMKTSVSATGTSASINEEASVDYPLPTLGLRGSFRMGENWRVTGFGQLLKLKINEYDGEVINFGGGIEWAFTPAMYAGLGYDYYKYNLSSTKERARGEFNYEFDGPKLYFGWNF
jgi:opacity protein-like surface antigen